MDTKQDVDARRRDRLLASALDALDALDSAPTEAECQPETGAECQPETEVECQPEPEVSRGSRVHRPDRRLHCLHYFAARRASRRRVAEFTLSPED